jgi:hypothetical protein
MDGSLPIKQELLCTESLEMKKSMGAGKLAELAMVDPKRAKRQVPFHFWFVLRKSLRWLYENCNALFVLLDEAREVAVQIVSFTWWVLCSFLAYMFSVIV